MKISKHISYKEATFSATAIRKGIDNTPNDYQLQNMRLLAEKIFEPLREWAGHPIAVNSFFRSDALNKAVKGATGSQHTQGRAIDLDDTFGGKTNKEMFDYLKGYSPVHNVKAGTKYPATLVTTGDHDDRVVPAHSFKFAAELQAKQVGSNPTLIRIDVNAGHGAGKSVAATIQEFVDMQVFTLYNMGIKELK